jgi:hypothetical protein
MSNTNAPLYAALGAGAGLGLWYLLRDDDDSTTAPVTSAATPTATGAPAGACTLRLDASGLTADGTPLDLAAAVARCQAAGRADIIVTADAPGAVLLDLTTALSEASVPIATRRNAGGRRSAARGRPRYALEGGRRILRDGIPIVDVARVDRGDHRFGITPHEADVLVRQIVDLLNGGAARRQAGRVDRRLAAAPRRRVGVRP